MAKERMAITDEAQERRCINLASSLAEQQLREGTASPLIIQHYLRLGSPRAQLEEERMQLENELIAAKTQAVKDEKDMKTIVSDALEAMKRYRGIPSDADYVT